MDELKCAEDIFRETQKIYEKNQKFTNIQTLPNGLPFVNHPIPKKEPNIKQPNIKQTNIKQTFYIEQNNIFVRNDQEVTEKNIGDYFNETSNLAILLGGDKKMWNKLNQIGQNIFKFNESYNIISNGLSNISSGYVGIAFSIISLAALLLDNDDSDENSNEWITQLFTMLQEIYNKMLKIYEKLENILINSVCHQLYVITTKLTKLESITCKSFQELHQKDLLDIIDSINKDFNDEFIHTQQERKQILLKLSSWIDLHSNVNIETYTNRSEDSFTELLSKTDDDAICYILNTTFSLVGMKNMSIPNLQLVLHASNLFFIANNKWKLVNTNNISKRIIAKINAFEECIDKIDEHILEKLYLQFKHFRFLIGREMVKNNITNKKNINVSMFKLYEYLDECELRRVLILRLSNLLGINCPYKLPTKDEFFAFANINDINCENVNETDQYNRNKIYYCALDSCDDPIKMHNLLKCPEANYDEMFNNIWSATTLDAPNNTRPIHHILAQGKYKQLIIFIANGYNINLNVVNLPWRIPMVHSSYTPWSDTSTLSSDHICYAVMKKLMANVVQLRKAYEYYKLCENGFTPNYNVDTYWLNVIACLLGNTINLEINYDTLFLFKVDSGHNLTFKDLKQECNISTKLFKNGENNYKKYLIIEKQKILDMPNIKVENKLDIWYKLLKPFVEISNDAIKQIYNNEQNHENLNLLNTMLKLHYPNYNIGANIDIALKN